ncbi:MAG: DUF1553 domain-containing protein [Planctomycetes bacterium]|nr:DUF1553 domain-containing protein [Planctomycetota bacterium]
MGPLLAHALRHTVVALTAGVAATQVPPPVDAGEFAQRRATHWAWQPLRDDAPPTAGQPATGHPVDAFVDHALAAAALRRAPPAPPHVQLRRLWFDLVGLPPPPDAVARFTADPSDAAWEREVDALLASAHYAERQARHWLDLVRYAETLGHEYDFEVPNAWRYRDYVIRAFRDDVPFDQFVREHVAGDLLTPPRLDDGGANESVQATAAYWFCEQTHSPVDAGKHEADRVDNQVDVLGKAFLGLTIACARCHDHKFDAIRAADYYAFAGFVQSSRYAQAPLRPADVQGAPFQRALTAQRELAAAWQDALAPIEPPPPPPPPRDGDRVVASAEDLAAGWILTNDGFGPQPWHGPLCLDPTATAPELRQLPGAFWHSAVAGRQREGTLASPTFPLTARYVHVRAAGQHARIKVIVDGFHLVRDPIYGELHKEVGNPDAHWLTFDCGAWANRPAFVQAIDQRTHDLADPKRERKSWPDDGWLAVQSVVLSPHREPPPAAAAPPVPPHAWTEPPTAVAAALGRLHEACAAVPVSPTLPAMVDGTGRDLAVAQRGDHRRPGEPAPRRFLQALAREGALATGPGSGRLQLAEAMTAEGAPLLARVLLNRLWRQLFDRGIARSVDNLGALGDPPTHPALLDWLAADFLRHGWSVKRALRQLVTSATYRQDSRRRAAAEAIDPANLLLHRQNVQRLDAESVRDALLAISGRLDPTLFGPPVELPRETIVKARGQPDRHGPLDGDGRRSIYLAVRRNFLPAMLLAFDLPTPFATVGMRNVSNVPAQALTLANDPFVHQQCATWANALLAAGVASGADADVRLTAQVDAAFVRAFARPPAADEVALCRDFLATGGASAWPDLLHGLVQAQEFLYLR